MYRSFQPDVSTETEPISIAILKADIEKAADHLDEMLSPSITFEPGDTEVAMLRKVIEAMHGEAMLARSQVRQWLGREVQS